MHGYVNIIIQTPFLATFSDRFASLWIHFFLRRKCGRIWADGLMHIKGPIPFIAFMFNLRPNISTAFAQNTHTQAHIQTNYLHLIINGVYYHAVKPNAFRIDYPVFFLDADFIHHVFIKEISSFIDANYIETEHISTNVRVFEYEFISSMIPCRKMWTHANPDAQRADRERVDEWQRVEKEAQKRQMTMVR